MSNIYRVFISLSGIYELSSTTTKTGTAERSISIGRNPSKFMWVIGAMAYLQVSPLGGSHDKTWRGQGGRKLSVSCVLEFAKTESVVAVQGRFQTKYHTEPLMDKTVLSGTRNSSRVAA
jgi:hypothetical protein